jgi:hypothetical protein
MEHPVLYVARFFRFLDRMIQDYGDDLYVGFAYLCVLIIVWMLVRRRKRSAHDITVVILPQPPRREPDPPPPRLFEEGSDL